VGVTLELVDPAAAGRAAALASIYDPTSPNYMHFMDQAEQAAAFGPDPALARKVVTSLNAAGLAAEWSRGSGSISADGSAAAVEGEFGVSIHEYRSLSGIRFRAATTPPAVPAALAAAIASELAEARDRQRLGRDARAKFDIARTVRAIEDVYKGVV